MYDAGKIHPASIESSYSPDTLVIVLCVLLLVSLLVNVYMLKK